MPVKVTPYLVMNGNANEAIAFYERALDAKVVFKQTFGEMPENPDFPLPADAKDRVSHATIQIGEDVLMFSDTFPGQPHQSGNQVTICISTNDKEQSKRFFDALKEDGKVSMPLQETFFSPAYAVLTDKFGVTWQIHTDGSHS
ncbi:VOC family protein [Alicyclobacillus shizuokensis]|uniref:VOC family protein n=1 Tax=Alicyclobacillus shizuokensis TaxID=392014 RepID=UPI000830C31B|nr:VOC family protein [Alicyclobacillus shizuokensis]